MPNWAWFVIGGAAGGAIVGACLTFWFYHTFKDSFG